MFFVATAPRDDAGHVNVSPKGLDTFRVLGPNRVAYLDLTGSGVETIAHLRENGRVTLMFCAFEGPPRIVRLYGRGSVLTSADPEFDKLANLFDGLPGRRAIIEIDLERVADSCGYAVPLYEHQGSRERLLEWAVNKGPDGLATYWVEKNHASIDGLPGLPTAPVPAAAAEGLQ
jgi:hypothetical protein